MVTTQVFPEFRVFQEDENVGRVFGLGQEFLEQLRLSVWQRLGWLLWERTLRRGYET